MLEHRDGFTPSLFHWRGQLGACQSYTDSRVVL